MWQNNIYLNILLAFILILFALSLYILKNYRKTSNIYIIILLFVSIGIIAAEYVGLGFASLSLKILFDRIAFTGIATIPVLWLLAALRISNNKRRINYKTISLISFIPAILIILNFTNDFHGLMWKEIYAGGAAQNILIKEPGLLFWVFIGYAVIAGILSLSPVLEVLFREKYYYKSHLGLLTAVIFISFLFIILDNLEIQPFSYISLAPIITASGIIFLMFIFNRKRKNVILSIAVNKIVEKMSDGVFVIDTENRILDFNNSAAMIFKIKNKKIIGEDILKVMQDVNIISGDDMGDVDIGGILDKEKDNRLIKIEDDGNTAYYNISISAINDFQDIMIGKYIIFENYSDRVRAEKEAKYAGYYDKLTGLPNKSYFEKEVENIDRDINLPISIVIGGVNSMRIINEAFGREKGDIVLCTLAKIFKDSVKKDSIICRWGEDKFAFIFPKTSRKEVEDIINKLRRKISSCKEVEIPLSIALGSATKEKSTEDIVDIIMEAESNMFKRKLVESGSVSSSILSSLERTLFEKSHETGAHAKRLDNYARILGKNIGLAENKLDILSLLASLHDIGKVAITEEILLKKVKLTEDEWEAIKKHPVVGSNIVRSTRQISHVAEGILHHHEWWNGMGYPDGLKGEEIPIESRIISIVDAYDVMRNGRPYKKKMTREEAIEELRKCSGTQFDPALVEIFIEKVLHEEGEAKKKKTKRKESKSRAGKSSKKSSEKSHKKSV